MPAKRFDIGTARQAVVFDIRLNEPSLILRGDELSAPGVIMKGKIVLCLTQSLKISNIHLQFKCDTRIMFPNQESASRGPEAPIITQKKVLITHDWTFPESQEEQDKTLPAGNYEWPFDAILDGDAPESIEGLTMAWIRYTLTAILHRPGKLAKSMWTKRKVRVIRVPDPGSLELNYGVNREGEWEPKVKYDVSTPSKAVAFGSDIPIDFTLIPLSKDYKIERVEAEIEEKQDLQLDASVRRPNNHHTMTRAVCQDKWPLPEGMEAEEIDGMEGYRFRGHLQLPKKLIDCSQSVEAFGIKIVHSIWFQIHVSNPDGHISTVKGTIPIKIYIPASSQWSELLELLDSGPQLPHSSTDPTRAVPPIYGEHISDQLWNENSPPPGYLTPSSPSTPFAQSRRGSADDLESMIRPSGPDSMITTLANRLNGLHMRPTIPSPQGSTAGPGNGTGTPPLYPNLSSSSLTQLAQRSPPDRSGSITDIHTTHICTSACGSRRASAEGQQHIEYGNLSRVPSYETASRVTNVSRPASDTDLPDYGTAISRPPSPGPVSPMVGSSSSAGAGRGRGRV